MRILVLGLAAVITVAAVDTLRSRAARSPVARATPTPLTSRSHGVSFSSVPTPWSASTRTPLPSRPNLPRTARALTAPLNESETAPSADSARPPARRDPPTRAPRTSGSPVEYLSDSLFRQLDTNRDGALTGPEIPTALHPENTPRAAIDADTFTKLLQSTVAALRADRVVALKLSAVPVWFTELDPAREGQVSLDRWRAAGRDGAEFGRIDTGGDAVLPQREVQVFAAQHSALPSARDTTPAVPSARGGGLTASVAPAAPNATRDTQNSASEAKPPSKADELFEHYTAIAAGVPPPKSGGLTTVMASPAKPASASAVPATPAPSPPAPAPAPAKPAAAKPPSATLPLPLTDHAYWVQRDTENCVALLAGTRPEVLFLGDSITDLLARGDGKPLWQEVYEPLGALNFGIGGITTSHVLWQVETGQVAMAAPKVVVLLIGSNNLGLGHTPQEVAAGVEKIVNEIGAQLPDTRILLLGVLPRGTRATDPFRPVIAETNQLLADLGTGDQVTYLDIGAWFVSPDGSLAAMPDGAHPNLFGYQLYTLAIWETLAGLLSEE